LKAKNSCGSTDADFTDEALFPPGYWAVASLSGGLTRAGSVAVQLFILVFIRLQSQILPSLMACARQRGLDSGKTLSDDDGMIHGTPANTSSKMIIDCPQH
jgi:hypothetical protein